jgi:CheY-like chemotaxis protein
MSKPVTVAVFNASDDTVEMLESLLQAHGFETVNARVSQIKRGLVDLVAFMEEHQPKAVIWDISPPYAENWAFFQSLRSSHALDGRCVVVTTTHLKHLSDVAGDSGAIEIVGKPYDLDRVLRAIQQCTT